MAKRGRKRLPTVVKLARGTLSKSRELPGNEPSSETVTELPDPPEHLGSEGVRVWRDQGGLLVKMGCLQDVDIELFAQYCILHDEFMEALNTVRRDGALLVDEKTGKVYKHPASVQMREWHQSILQMASQFGLTPSSRNGLRVPKKEVKEKTGAARFFDRSS